MANIQRQHQAASGNGEQPDLQVIMEALTNIATHAARIRNIPGFNQGNLILEALHEFRQGVVADFRQELHKVKADFQREIRGVRREVQEVGADLQREIQESTQTIAGLRQRLAQVQKTVDGIHGDVVIVWEELGTVQAGLAALRTELMQEAQRLRDEISRQ